MEDKLLVALVAAASAVVGGAISAVLGPIIKHRLEQKSEDSERKRVQIRKWREMLGEVQKDAGGNMNPNPLLHVHPDFLTLEPHLKPEIRRRVHGENRTFLVGSGLAKPLRDLALEIERIELEWGVAK